LLAGCVFLYLNTAAEAAVYKTPTRQKQAARAQSRSPASATPASKQRPVKATTVAKIPRESFKGTKSVPVKQTQVARTSTSTTTTTSASAPQRSADMLALEALERAPVPEARRTPAAQPVKPTAPPKSADSLALDALIDSH
jgi:hypothetical protein